MKPGSKTNLLLALLASGIASIINQIVWQRALKIYLSGSEAVSSMIVVFIFMLGLGIGASIAGAAAHRLKNPLRSLAIIEWMLALINVIVCCCLSLDLHHSIYAFQCLALEYGMSLQWLYAVTAAAILAIPCILMGMTVPIASEAAQRQMHYDKTRFLSSLFFLNTLGAVLGAVVGSVILLPILGQWTTLLFAIGLNALAGVLALITSLGFVSLGSDMQSDHSAASLASSFPSKFQPELWAGFCLGFVSLAYEMSLYRLAALVFTPLPYTFAFVLTIFLLIWSIGVYCGGLWNRRLPLWLSVLTALLLLAMPAYILARWGFAPDGAGIPKLLVFAVLFAPCLPFGVLFTQLVEAYAQSWGKDVGRYFAFNTFGSCLGILLATLIGFEFRPEYAIWLFAVTTALLAIWFSRLGRLRADKAQDAFFVRLALGLSAIVILIQVALWQAKGHNLDANRVVTAYYGKGGVVEIDKEQNLGWDGLWHSRLSKNEDHIGSNNWTMAVIPLLCHAQTGKNDSKLGTCVVGLGTGITAGTLARYHHVSHVDVYEINETLIPVLAQYPEGTLHVETSNKVKILWQDGRTGLALRTKKYDLITQQPLYLKQAGSSILLSREYFELVRSRLNEGGVYCIYCNSFGNEKQAMMVRQTAHSVFRYCETFGGGYMIVASESPIHYDAKTILDRLKNDPELSKECEAYGIKDLCEYKDLTPLPWHSPYVVTDDHPLVEYPWLIRLLVH